MLQNYKKIRLFKQNHKIFCNENYDLKQKYEKLF